MSRTQPPPTPHFPPAVVLGGVCVIALNLRWFIPAEDTADGATLWLAAFWCVAAVLVAWFPFAQDAIARRWTRADAAVACLVGGHVLSGVLVLLLGGNRHAAATLLAEWLGIGAVWSVLRELVRVPGYRAAIWQSTILILVALAVMGCWQHWLELPSMAQRLGPKFDSVRSARASGGTSPAEQELSREGVPLNEPDFTLFEKRLRDSREPFGFFALANTLGGFLAAGLMLLIGNRLLPGERGGVNPPGDSSAHTGVTITATVIVSVCLLLTKSRTALLSVILVGVTVLVLRAIGTRLHLSVSRRHVGLIAGGLAAAGVVVFALSRSGSWDREVLTEAAKSLTYRVYYWTGTATLIGEHPILGGGLGQFRSAYLRVKDAAASEEIADPHNFVLDVWFNGGMLAIAGALWLVATLIITTVKAARSDTGTHTLADSRLLLAGAAAPLVAFMVQFFGPGYWDDRLIVVGFALLVTAWFVSVGNVSVPVPTRAACGLAALVLFTHLLGAGGIGYTTVVQFLLLCLAATFSPVVVTETPVPSSLRSVWLRRGAFITAAVGVVLLWRPDVRSAADAADQLVTRGASAEAIRAAYTRAMNADRWNPLPAAKLAEFEFQQWETETVATGGADANPEKLAAAGRAMHAAEQRDPANGHWWDRHGEMVWTGWKRKPSPVLAKEAARLFAEAVARNPTNAVWQASLSDAAEAAGEPELAEKTAQTALTQDEVNQRFGHIERILAADVRARLEQRVARPRQE